MFLQLTLGLFGDLAILYKLVQLQRFTQLLFGGQRSGALFKNCFYNCVCQSASRALHKVDVIGEAGRFQSCFGVINRVDLFQNVWFDLGILWCWVFQLQVRKRLHCKTPDEHERVYIYFKKGGFVFLFLGGFELNVADKTFAFFGVFCLKLVRGLLEVEMNSFRRFGFRLIQTGLCLSGWFFLFGLVFKFSHFFFFRFNFEKIILFLWNILACAHIYV